MAICRALLDAPGDQRCWATGRASACQRTPLARLFLRETGMSFGAWRQQARVLEAMGRLGGGEPCTGGARSRLRQRERVQCDVPAGGGDDAEWVSAAAAKILEGCRRAILGKPFQYLDVRLVRRAGGRRCDVGGLACHGLLSFLHRLGFGMGQEPASHLSDSTSDRALADRVAPAPASASWLAAYAHFSRPCR